MEKDIIAVLIFIVSLFTVCKVYSAIMMRQYKKKNTGSHTEGIISAVPGTPLFKK